MNDLAFWLVVCVAVGSIALNVRLGELLTRPPKRDARGRFTKRL